MQILARCEQRGALAVGQQHAGPGIGAHGVQARSRDVAVQRQIGGTGLEHGEDGNDQIDAARQAHGDDAFRYDAEPDQMMGELVGAGIEFGVVDCLGLRHDRDRLRRAPRLCGDGVMQEAAAVEIGSGGVETVQLRQFLRLDCRKRGDCGVIVSAHPC